MKKSTGIILIIIIVLLLGVIAVGGYLLIKGKDESAKKNEEAKNEVANTVENEISNTTNNQTSNLTNNDVNKNTNSNATNTTPSNTNTTASSELVVYREGAEEKIPAKEYESTYGYTMKYASDYFKASNHDNRDWFDRDQDINCVVVDKENVSYSNKIATLSNAQKTTVNGYEAVYTTKSAEGQLETTYYVNTGKDVTYMITTSCQDSAEYLEGLAKIMNAMVQTFKVK